jgi:DNA repair exonuclease SbcCD ATPase subunit
MSAGSERWAAERLTALARAAAEGRRYAAPERAGLDEARDRALATLDQKKRSAVLEEVEPLIGKRAAPPPAVAAAPGEGPSKTSAGELLRERASLQLRLQAEEEKRKEVEQARAHAQKEHREAIEALALQQRRVKELQADRTNLLSEISGLESKLRVQVNATEQAELKYEKLKASRQVMGDQATEQAEQINALKAENGQLKRQLEAVLQERDRDVAGAKGVAEQAEEARAEVAFQRLWARMRAEVPEVFVETHVPTEKTFEELCDALVEFLRTFVVLELHVHHLLRDLRQVSEKSDKLNHFYIMLTKNPGLVETLRDYLVTGKRKGNFMNLLRAHQAWVRAFASGTYGSRPASPRPRTPRSANTIRRRRSRSSPRSWGPSSASRPPTRPTKTTTT